MRSAALLLLLLCACGYRWGPKPVQQPLPEGELPRVAVEPFDNATYRRGFEILLTRLLNDEVRSRTGAEPVSKEKADRVLRGSIRQMDERVISEDRNDVVRESSVRIRVAGTVWDRTTQKVIRTYSLVETEPFSPRAGRIRTFDQAAVEALRDLAEQIVYYGLEGEGPSIKKANGNR